jgi:hypothetical protein
MTVIKRIIAPALVVIVALALVSAGSPASASSGDCPSSTVCTWNGTNWSGTPAFVQNMGGFGSCYNVSSLNGANNAATSVYNRELFQVSFYDSFGGGGYMFSLAAGSGISDLGSYPAGGAYNNRISSICHE